MKTLAHIVYPWARAVYLFLDYLFIANQGTVSKTPPWVWSTISNTRFLVVLGIRRLTEILIQISVTFIINSVISVYIAHRIGFRRHLCSLWQGRAPGECKGKFEEEMTRWLLLEDETTRRFVFTKGTITSVSALIPKLMGHSDIKRHLSLSVDKSKINRWLVGCNEDK